MQLPFLRNKNVEVFIKREELIHPHISVNKWRKLKYHLHEAVSNARAPLITFGGAFSNHLVAVAAAGYHLGIATLGMIRSYTNEMDNATIQLLRSYRMETRFLHPDVYAVKEKHPLIADIISRYPNHFLISEGGTSSFCIKGVKEMMAEVNIHERGITHVIAGVGTGGTLAGIIKSMEQESVKVIGISPFKGPVTNLPGLKLLTRKEQRKVNVIRSVPETRFAALDQRIVQFIEEFKEDTGITLDPVYTAKVVMTTFHLIRQGYFQPGAKLLIIHTGGLQGNEGYMTRIKTTG